MWIREPLDHPQETDRKPGEPIARREEAPWDHKVFSGGKRAAPQTKYLGKLRAHAPSCLQIPTIHDRQTKAAGRHGMCGCGAVRVKGDLNAGHAGCARKLRQSVGARMAVFHAMRP